MMSVILGRFYQSPICHVSETKPLPSVVELNRPAESDEWRHNISRWQGPLSMILSVVIPVKNDAVGLERCLKSIQAAALASLSYEIVVVDNGSADNSVAIAKAYGAKTIVAPDQTVAALRNLGANESVGEYLAFLDADCSVGKNWFESVAKYVRGEGVACFGCPPTVPDDATWVQTCWYQIRKKRLFGRKVFEVEWLESMNFFVKRSDFMEVSGFDEQMITCEDVDLCKRLSARSPIICDNGIVAIHHGEAETLTHFYQKERWRGTSNWQSLRKHDFDKSELPSVLLPVVHLFLLFVVALASVLAAYKIIPLYVVFIVLGLWQVPLLWLGLKKSGEQGPVKLVAGIFVLLNLYFFARAVSLFSHVSWNDPKTFGSGASVVL